MTIKVNCLQISFCVSKTICSCSLLQYCFSLLIEVYIYSYFPAFVLGFGPSTFDWFCVLFVSTCQTYSLLCIQSCRNTLKSQICIKFCNFVAKIMSLFNSLLEGGHFLTASKYCESGLKIDLVVVVIKLLSNSSPFVKV